MPATSLSHGSHQAPDLPGTEKVTLKILADAANVSCSTASRALRNHPRISASTIQKVQTLANRLGYSRDARLTELMSHLRHRKKTQDRPVMALLIWQSFSFNSGKLLGFFEGLWSQIHKCGYKPEVFNINDFADNPMRLSRILKTRNIREAILCPAERPYILPEMEWDSLSLVAIGYSIDSEFLHRCAINHYEGIMKSWKELNLRGYQRIGLVLDTTFDLRTHGYHHAAFLAAQATIDPAQRVPVFMASDPDMEGNFQNWIRKEKPDAMICAKYAPSCERWLGSLGLSIPENMGIIDMQQPTASGYSGIHQDFADLCKAAVEFVISLSLNNQTGLAKSPRTVFINGTWVEGTSLRKTKAGNKANGVQPSLP